MQSISVGTQEKAMHDKEYSNVVLAMQKLAQLDSYKKCQLFTVDTTGLYELYLSALQPRARQYFTCRTCEKFFDKYGGLVVLDQVSGPKSIVWPIGLPGAFGEASRRLSMTVSSRPVKDAFYPTERILGTPQLPVGVWDHLHLDLGASRKLYIKPFADGKTVAVRSNYAMLSSNNEKYSYADVYAAVNGLVAGGYTSGVHAATLANLRWFLEVKEQVDRSIRYNYNIDCTLWAYAANAPDGYCNLGSTVAGSYLQGVVENPGTALWSYMQRVAPTAYKRPTVAPTAGAVNEATELFNNEGLASSLKRRSALLSEVELLWNPRKKVAVASSAVFGSITTKDSARVSGRPGRNRIMTWTRFLREIVPHATSIKYVVPYSATYGSITAAVVRGSKPLFLWGNSYSWYTYDKPTPSSSWRLSNGSEVGVLGIAAPPYAWSSATTGNTAELHWPEKSFVILAGALDMTPHGPAIFPQLLPRHLYKYRSVIEQHCKENYMEAYLPGQQASGLLLEDNGPMPTYQFIVSVGSERFIVEIDRWS